MSEHRQLRASGPSFGAIVALIAFGALMLFVATGTDPAAMIQGFSSGTRIRLSTDSNADFSRLEGRYKVHVRGDRVRLKIRVDQPGIDWSYSSTLRKRELTRGPAGFFGLQRDAGIFRLDGLEQLDGRATGDFTFVPDPEYAAALESHGHRIDPAEQFRLGLHDIRITFVEAVARYDPGIDLQDIVRLRNHGVDRDYLEELQQADYGDLAADDMIRLRIHGVDAGEAGAMARAGFGRISVEELIRLRNHGIRAEFVEELVSSGMDAPAVEELIRLNAHGISPGYVRGMHRAGYPVDSIEAIIRLNNHGVTVSYLEGLTDAGYGEQSFDDIIRLGIHGVSTEFVRDAREAAGREYDPDELIRLQAHGVDARFIRRMVQAGHETPSPEQLIRLRNEGA